LFIFYLTNRLTNMLLFQNFWSGLYAPTKNICFFYNMCIARVNKSNEWMKWDPISRAELEKRCERALSKCSENLCLSCKLVKNYSKGTKEYSSTYQNWGLGAKAWKIDWSPSKNWPTIEHWTNQWHNQSFSEKDIFSKLL